MTRPSKDDCDNDKENEGVSASAGSAAAGGPDPVLSALGEDGLNRLMWEYYKAYVHKRPKYGNQSPWRTSRGATCSSCTQFW